MSATHLPAIIAAPVQTMLDRLTTWYFDDDEIDLIDPAFDDADADLQALDEVRMQNARRAAQ